MRRFKPGLLFIAVISINIHMVPFPLYAGAQPEIIPREVLFGNPSKAKPQISPDGTMLAYLAPLDGVLNVWVRSIDSADDRPVTKDNNRGIRHYFWAYDNNHLMYFQDRQGDENWRLYGVNLKSGVIRDFTPFDDVQVRLIEHNRYFPNEMIIAINKQNPQAHDVYRLDLSSGDITLVMENFGDVSSWLIDNHLKVRGALVSTADGGFKLMVRDDLQDKWRELIVWELEEAINSGTLGFSKDGKKIYLADSRTSNTSQLVKVDIETQAISAIAHEPDYDLGQTIFDPDSYEVQAVSFMKERLVWRVFDRAMEEDFRIIRRLADGDFSLVSRDKNDRLWIIAFTKDTGPVSYYIYDRKSKKARFLFDHKPELNRYTLAKMESGFFRARDGLTIPYYIIFPPGNERKNLPAVVHVHGGPWTRDSWGYDPTAQWLANRGYAVLQVNFRGSTGYGKEFVNAGNKEWGGKMHNDIVDGVNWLIEEGIADRKRIAIYGVSYGGYAALVGAAFTPGLFRCAIDVVGPSNLITTIKSIPPYWTTYRNVIYKRVGNPDSEEEFLKSRSPLFKADSIKIPILITQGANDPRVKQAEAEQIVEALKRQGLEYEYLLFPDEGHGLVKPDNRVRFYAAAEKFLAKYLGGRYEELSQ
ncbi:MAG: S9 family peptidase [Candidatus Omnitrophota bacterium]